MKNNNVTVKTGTVKDFFDKVRGIMKNLDKGKPIAPSHTITFEEPSEMLHFLHISNKCIRITGSKR